MPEKAGVSFCTIETKGLEISLYQAWGLWADGISINEYQLLGVPIFWWGRIGKIMQFSGAFLIIFEIIGFKRLQNFKKSFFEVFNLPKLRKLAFYGFHFNKYWFKYLKGDKELEKSIKENPLFITNILLSLVTSIWIGVYFGLQSNWIAGYLIGSVAFAICGWTIPLFISMGIIVVGLFIAIPTITLLNPIIWCLGHRNFKLILNILTFILLLVGVHFDLLTS